MTERSSDRGALESLALALLWSRDEPGRVGEVILVPPGDRGAVWTFGRDTVGDGGASRGLGFARQRPGVTQVTGALACPRISRVQLHLSAEPTGALVVENVGRCPLVHEGREVARAELLPGDVIELRHELVLLCVRRPGVLAPLPPEYPVDVQPFGEPDVFGLVGEGPAIWALRVAMTALARREVHVLVLGPSGSGKELVAHAIHAESPRRERALVARNAATIPEGLVDAELFGHAKNFPNPGTPERHGLVGEAAGGTLFLDELAELPSHLQAHLLRVLDDGEYHRLGESRARRAELRLIAATNRSEKALKHDVLARLKARLFVPELGARREDIPLLVRHLLRRQAVSEPSLVARFFPGSDPGAAPRTTPDLMTALVRHRFGTHVRELDSLLLCASIESRGKYLERTEGVDRLLQTRGEAPADRPSGAAARSVEGSPVGAGGGAGEPFSAEETRRLALQRKHGFQAAECGRDPEYGSSRQTADLHLRQLMSRALAMTGWDVDAASALLAGPDSGQTGKLRRRLETFLFNLRRRLEEEGRDALRQALASEWRASAPTALRLLEAIEAGRLRGGRATG